MSLTPRGGSRLATPDAAAVQPHSKPRPLQDSAADRRGARPAAAMRDSHERDAQDGADVATRAVRAELALMPGLGAAMAAHLEPQLVRGLHGVPDVTVAATARILVQRVVAAVLQSSASAPHTHAKQPAIGQHREGGTADSERDSSLPRRPAERRQASTATQLCEQNRALRHSQPRQHSQSPDAHEHGRGDVRALSGSRERDEQGQRDCRRERTESPLPAECTTADARGHAHKRARASRDRDAAATHAANEGALGAGDPSTAAGLRLSRREEIQAAQKARELRRKREAMGIDTESDGDGYPDADAVTNFAPLDDTPGGFVRVVQGQEPRGAGGVQQRAPQMAVTTSEQRPLLQPHGSAAHQLTQSAREPAGGELAAAAVSGPLKVRAKVLCCAATLQICRCKGTLVPHETALHRCIAHLEPLYPTFCNWQIW